FYTLQRPPLSTLFPYTTLFRSEQIEMVKAYFYTRIWDVPAYMAMLTMMGWSFGMQNAIFPLILTAFINILNMGMSYYLVAYQGMEIRGVALGTVIAQYLGCVLALILFMRRYRKLTFSMNIRELFDIATFRRFIVMNRDLFLRTILLTFVFAFFYSQSSTFGVLSLAVSVVIMQ